VFEHFTALIVSMGTLQDIQIMANNETNFMLLVGKAVTSYAIPARKIIFSYWELQQQHALESLCICCIN
jgi:hypothetical protein